MSGRTVAITGAGGFIGSHLVEHLLHRGANVRALVRSGSVVGRTRLDGFLSAPGGRLTIDQWSIEEPDSLAVLLRECETIFHLAALSSVPHSHARPDAYLRTNVAGTLTVLRACRTARPARLVYISSSEVYGPTRYDPVDERHPLAARSPYAASKIAAEKLCESFAHTTGPAVVILRLFNVYGPRQSTGAIVPRIVAQALRARTVRLRDVDIARDFSYVSDAVLAMTALSRCAVRERCSVVNVGSGVSRTLGHIVRTVAHVLGVRLWIQGEIPPPMKDRYADSRGRADRRKLRELVGPLPATRFEHGIRNVIQELVEAAS
ncbi:GDP-mannose 4,6-dehydratase [Streptomyces sp. NPDC127098]|uniref:GDP-mannose 4,6-dehydratase n=1 Tax=Streptomyces sp. NPDC127098 TaxID=3347137 RepID=UPI0036523CA0